MPLSALSRPIQLTPGPPEGCLLRHWVTPLLSRPSRPLAPSAAPSLPGPTASPRGTWVCLTSAGKRESEFLVQSCREGEMRHGCEVCTSVNAKRPERTPAAPPPPSQASPLKPPPLQAVSPLPPARRNESGLWGLQRKLHPRVQQTPGHVTMRTNPAEAAQTPGNRSANPN